MNKTCVIVGAVPLGKERTQLETLLKSDSVYKIAADGGIKAFLEAGVLPDHWLGDMDSAAELGLLEGVEHEVTDMSEYSTRVAVDRTTAERRQKTAVGGEMPACKTVATNYETAVNSGFCSQPNVTATKSANPNSHLLTIRDVLKTIVPVVKDDTDMALGLKKAFEVGCDEVLIFGGMGGSRTSHSFANVQLMHQFAASGKKITMITESGKMFILHNDSVEYPETAEGFISVISLSDVAENVIIEGLFYEYHGNLTNQLPLGVSNEFVGKKAHIAVGKGTLLIIEEKFSLSYR